MELLDKITAKSRLFGKEGALTAEQWFAESRDRVAEAERLIAAAEDLRRESEAAASSLAARATTSTDASELAELEQQQRATRHAARAARNEIELRRRDELEPAVADVKAAELAVAGGAALDAQRRAIEAAERFFETPDHANLEVRQQVQLERAQFLAHARQLAGVATWLPDGWIDEPSPPGDAKQRARALLETFQPKRELDAKTAVRAEAVERARRDRISHAVRDANSLVLVNALEDPEERAEALAEHRRLHDAPRARLREKLATRER